jgi:uncharacterized membrane protein YqhA
MKRFYYSIKTIIFIIAMMVFLSGLVFTMLAVYDFVTTFAKLEMADKHRAAGLMAVDMLHSVDYFLIATVFFVLSFGMVVLFTHPDEPFPVNIPTWLRIHNFVELKVILWEAILTTLVVSYLARLAEGRINGEKISLYELIVPGAVLLISMSLYFVKKGEK